MIYFAILICIDNISNSKLYVSPRWLSGRAFDFHARDRDSIPSRYRPKSLKQVVTKSTAKLSADVSAMGPRR